MITVTALIPPLELQWPLRVQNLSDEIVRATCRPTVAKGKSGNTCSEWQHWATSLLLLPPPDCITLPPRSLHTLVLFCCSESYKWCLFKDICSVALGCTHEM